MNKLIASLAGTVFLFSAAAMPLLAQEAEDYSIIEEKFIKRKNETQIKPYGTIYLFSGYQQKTVYDSGGQSSTSADLNYSLNRFSNAGIRFKTNNMAGEVEAAPENDNSGEIELRKAYAIYKISAGEIMVGKNWAPYTRRSMETAGFNRSVGFGALEGDPELQVRFKFNFGLYIDLMKPYIPSSTDTFFDDKTTHEIINESKYYLRNEQFESTTKLPVDSFQSYIPKTIMGFNYTYNSSGLKIDTALGAGANIYKISDNRSERVFNKEWLVSYLGFLYCAVDLSGFLLKINGGYIINPVNFGIKVQGADTGTYTAGTSLSVMNIATGLYEIKDTQNIQSFIEAGYKFGESFSVFAGYGFSLIIYGIPNSKDDFAMQYYLSSEISLTENYSILPSLSYRNYMKNMKGNNEGSEFLAGISVMFKFE